MPRVLLSLVTALLALSDDASAGGAQAPEALAAAPSQLTGSLHLPALDVLPVLAR